VSLDNRITQSQICSFEILLLSHKDMNRLKYGISYDNEVRLFLQRTLITKNNEFIKLYLFYLSTLSVFEGLYK